MSIPCFRSVHDSSSVFQINSKILSSANHQALFRHFLPVLLWPLWLLAIFLHPMFSLTSELTCCPPSKLKLVSLTLYLWLAYWLNCFGQREMSKHLGSRGWKTLVCWFVLSCCSWKPWDHNTKELRLACWRVLHRMELQLKPPPLSGQPASWQLEWVRLRPISPSQGSQTRTALPTHRIIRNNTFIVWKY